MLVSPRSSRMLAVFGSSRLDDSLIGTTSTKHDPWTPTSEILLTKVTIYKNMIADIGAFITTSMQQTDAMIIFDFCEA